MPEGAVCKGALVQLAKVLAVEGGPLGIRAFRHGHRGRGGRRVHRGLNGTPTVQR